VISGLSRAVVVVEASHKSGSLITAECALEQGREVMAVPGAVAGDRNRGAHALIRDGAKIVECADDIVEELGWPGGAGVLGPAPSASASPSESTRSSDVVMRRMMPGQAYDVDALSRAAGLDATRLLCHLADLELAGLIRRVAGGRFVRS
jgi:DNA processing protein